MKKLIIILAVVLCGQLAMAQCSKPSVLTSSLTEYLDANSVVQKTVDEKSVIEISKNEIVITAGTNPKMIGVISSETCNWKTNYKEGKSVINATFAKEGNPSMNAVITIEGKEGKLFVLIAFPDRPERKIRVTGDKFEEKI